jgi:transposase
MKFKSQARQNQLIEKITSSHLVVGIDIAQQTHVARAVNFRGIIIGEALSFTNDEDGFNSLLQWIQKLQTAHHLSATSSAWNPRDTIGLTCLDGWLHANCNF